MTSADPTSTWPHFDPAPLIANELSVPQHSVGAVLRMLTEGATVPFIARYRKEQTENLDEVQIRNIQERNEYLTELDARKRSVAREIAEQGKLSKELEKKLREATTKAEVEDLYLPFKPKRRTRAMMAKERGLEPLADRLWEQSTTGKPEAEAAAFVDAEKQVPDVAAALAGARDICAERINEIAEVRQELRRLFLERGIISVKKARDFAEQKTKFDGYDDFSEPVARIPSHRFLAIRRGESEGVLRASLEVDTEPVQRSIRRRVGLNPRSPWAAQLELTIEDALARLLVPSTQVETRVELKSRSDQEAVNVFAQNLRELLLSAPLGGKTVLGIDPGQRTGCKCVVLDHTGQLLAHENIYLVQGGAAAQKAKDSLRRLCRQYTPRAIAVGNGTHGRETESFVKDLLKEEGLAQDDLFCVSVSEAGASVYSASDIAREEFPDLDLTVRGAVSIARRLQDPLAELVKIDPKSIGVGQYQHDVYQPFLTKKLDEVVESCVNQVGVEVNTASAPLLSRVAGIGPRLATKIVTHRNQHGAFGSRKALLKVSGLGPRAFEQAAGFLRISGASNPLDASAVHPERYELVERMAADLGVPVASLVANRELVERLDLATYRGEDVGDYTLRDILEELKKPGRDPRASFERPQFRDDIRSIEDLTPGLQLEGVVTNVTAFGAFVDVGVHQDGLVHISQLADRFVKTPSDIVKVGDKLKVRVLEVDLGRGRIALSARQGEAPQDQKPQTGGRKPSEKGTQRGGPGNQTRGAGAAGKATSKRQGKPGKSPPGDSNRRGSDRGQESFSYNPFANKLRR